MFINISIAPALLSMYNFKEPFPSYLVHIKELKRNGN